MAHRIDDTVDDFYSDIKKSRKALKEDILDETFKKAEISKGLRPKEEKKVTKKTFLKLGIILIIIAIISLVVINHLTWMYVKYDADYGTIEELYYRELVNKEDQSYKEIDYIFESQCTNCSNNSKNYIGITKDDFTNIPYGRAQFLNSTANLLYIDTTYMSWVLPCGFLNVTSRGSGSPNKNIFRTSGDICFQGVASGSNP